MGFLQRAKASVVAFGMAAVFVGCGGKASDPPANSKEVSFALHVQPIFDVMCVHCHDGLQESKLDLRKGSSWTNLVNVHADGDPMELRVTPASPGASLLVNRISGDSSLGTPMPEDKGPLKVVSPSDYEIVLQWISDGAKNN